MRRSANYFKMFSKYLKKVKFIIAILVIFSFMLAGVQLVFPVIWGNILNNFINISSIDYAIFLKYIVIYIVLEFIEGILTIIKNILYSAMEEKTTLQLKEDLYAKMLNLEIKAFDKNRITFFTQKLTEDTHILIASFIKIIYTVINIIKLVMLIIFSYSLCKDIGIIFAAFSIIIYFAIILLKPFGAKGERLLNSQVKKYSNELYKDVMDIREIKTLGIKKYLKNIWRVKDSEISKKINGIKNTNSLLDLLIFTLRFSVHSIILVASSYFFYTGKIDFACIIIFELYSAIMFNTVKQISNIKINILTYKNSLKSIFDILSNKSYENEKFGTRDELNSKENLIIKNLSFSYGNNKMLLDDLSFEIEFGKKVAIVDMGENAKHIFANLILRLYDPTEGRIMIGNVNIKELSEKALRRVISYVSSNPYIIEDTIENNLRLVKSGSSLEEIEVACEKAGIFKWFKNYEKEDILSIVIGRDGYTPTEVQRQQIAIARAILQKSSIVIIDEMQTDMNMEETYDLAKAIENIEEATVVMLSENVSQLTTCDEVITLKDSVIANIAGHNDIFKNKNIYSKMAEIEKQRKELEKMNKIKEQEVIDDKLINEEMGTIKKLNTQKGAQNEEHRIFSQIW